MKPRLARDVGRTFFGTDPDAYDAARPGHAPEVYDVLREHCGLEPGKRVLEVGPGTGQATRRLLELGAGPLVAIEPDPMLADYLRRALGDRVEVRVAALEDAELEPGSYDLAVAASSFHWVDQDVGLARLSDTLRPGGNLALWWTLFGDENSRDVFREALDPLFENVPNGPSQPRAEGRPSFARDIEERLADLERAGLEELAHDEFRWTREWDVAGIRALYSTFSPIGALDPERREELLDGVASVAETQFRGLVERPLVTSLYTARKPS